MFNDTTFLSHKSKNRVIKEMNKMKYVSELIDNRFLYVPINLYRSLDIRTRKKGRDPALILNLKDYPWRCPKISFLSVSASRIYRNTPFLIKGLYQLSGKECLCCNSFVFPEKWTPACSITDIFDEFLNITEIKARLIERIYCDKVQDQLLDRGVGQRLPLEDIKISEYL